MFVVFVSVPVANGERASGVEDFVLAASPRVSDSHSGSLRHFALCVLLIAAVQAPWPPEMKPQVMANVGSALRQLKER